jgi:hypothetical protein
MIKSYLWVADPRVLRVIPAKAGIQALNGIARLARDSQKLCAGGSAPAPWVTFFARAKKVTKESTPPDGAIPSLRFSPESARAPTRRAQNTRSGLEHEARDYPDAGCDAQARHTGFLLRMKRFS